MLVNGRWDAEWQPIQKSDEAGGFVRQTSSFRNWVTEDGTAGPTGKGGFPAEVGRYHLYVALICPWASRVLIARALKGLEDIISVTVLDPFLTDQGWRFGTWSGADGIAADGPDPFSNATYMHEIYTNADPTVSGRATVPVLWDKKRQTIVNNESADILRMLNSAFDTVGAAQEYDLYPDDHAEEIDALGTYLYGALNNGVYRAAFAVTQSAYAEAYHDVFDALDQMEQRLSDGRRFLFGGHVTETDIRLFVTLVRFDAAYHGLFKTNRNQISDMPNLSRLIDTMLSLPGVRETVSIDHIKAGYYSIKALNPHGLVPVGPKLTFKL